MGSSSGILSVLVFIFCIFNDALQILSPVDAFELIILHNNDMHARFEQTGVYSNACPAENILSNNCYGGFARVATELKKYRNEAASGQGPPVLYLNAGDTYTGTPWFTLYKDKIVSRFLNLLRPDAISLGNHEFDFGVEGVLPFLNNVTFPVLVANLDLTNTPELQSIENFKKSTVLIVNGTKIGIIGYLTPETKFLVPANTVEYFNETDSINDEAAVLKASGVNILIALGHSGFEMDKQIAKDCSDIDLVIGGHTNTFLYNGNQPDIETVDGPYPVVIQQSGGKMVPVVQAYAYTKYLGYIKLMFDDNGNLLEWNGTPILLNGSVPQDKEIEDVLLEYVPQVLQSQENVIGITKVLLDGSCRINECNLGNLLTDAMVYSYALNYNGLSWTDAPIAFLQGGGIRSSKPKGNITRYDLFTILPFGEALTVITVTGTEIRLALERSVERYTPYTGYGEFLQMSGVQVVYDMEKPSGERVQSIIVRCGNCSVPRFYPLVDSAQYKIIISQFLRGGGDGFDMFKKPNEFQLDDGDLDTAEKYISHMQTVYPAKEWRITLLNLQTMTTADGTTITPTTVQISTTTDGDGSGSRIAFSMGILLTCILLNLLR